VARIDIYESIGYDPWFDEGVGAKQFAKDLREIKASRIELHINSPGGFAFDGVTMYNALRDHDAFVAVTVDGMAASAASIIAMAGDEVTMNRASEMMVHDASGLCYGQARDMEEMREFLDGISDDIAAIYADRAGGTKAEWREIMHGETWFSAQEAVDAGLADRIVELKEEDAEKAKTRFDLRIFAHAGRANAPAPKLRATSPELTRDNVTGYEYDTLLVAPAEELSLLNFAQFDVGKLRDILREIGIDELFTSNRVTAGSPILMASGQVGEYRVEKALGTETWREQKTQRNWFQTDVRPVAYVTDPFAALQINGVA
jgi:ATP-dependent protease ClpP protease subunit